MKKFKIFSSYGEEVSTKYLSNFKIFVDHGEKVNIKTLSICLNRKNLISIVEKEMDNKVPSIQTVGIVTPVI